MTTKNSLVVRMLGLAIGLGAAMSAQAANTWYTLTDSSATTTAGVNINGYYAVNGANNVLTGASGTSTWTAYTVGYSAGLGLTMGSDGSVNPNHAVDNAGNTEAILLNFTSAVALSAIDLGWLGCASGTQTTGCATDADITIYRYSAAPTTTTNPMPLGSQKATYSSMTTAGWTLVGNYADLSLDTNTTTPYNTVNGATNNNGTLTDGTTYSSWWLISAFNSGLGNVAAVAGSGTVTSGLNNGNDYFKLYSVAASTCTGTVSSAGACTPPSNSGGKVPEPATLALTTVALLAVIGLRRRRAKLAA